MAKNTKKSSSSSSSSSSGKSRLSLNKFSFWVVVATALLCLIAMLLSVFNVGSSIVNWLRGLATACAVVIAAILAWRFVANKPIVWKILYIACLIVVIVCIIVPLVI